MKKRVIIVLSTEENFYGSAIKIQEELVDFVDVEIVNIEDIYDNYEICSEDIIYFLCNGCLVSKYIKKIKQKKCLIYNCEYLEKNYSKFEVQELLKRNNILIPKIIYDDIYNVRLPIFCKENKHAGIVFQAFTVSTLKKFFSKFELKDFYLEESINKVGAKEIKVYYVNGKLSYKDKIKIKDNKLKSICFDVSSVLSLNVFSADFIKQDNQYFLIDINPAAGFYLSSEARKNLVNGMKKEL